MPAAAHPPCVSVVIPTYRHAGYVVETLQSVFAQTFADFEVIVVNDGSPDDTAAVLRPWAESGRIRYFEQKNAGQSAARNFGIAQARGSYLALLDDDDLWPADALAWRVAALEHNAAAALVYGFATSFGLDENYRVPGNAGPAGAVKRVFLRGNYILSPGQTLIRLSVLRKVGGLDSTLWGTDDWDLWVRLAGAGDYIYEERSALLYRCHRDNASKDAARLFRNALRLLHKHLGRTPLGPQWSDWWACRHFIGLFTSVNELSQASVYAQKGRSLDMLRSLLRAWRFHPPLILTARFWKVWKNRQRRDPAPQSGNP